jgi:glutamate-5-semialdehyde dehydrogenase
MNEPLCPPRPLGKGDRRVLAALFALAEQTDPIVRSRGLVRAQRLGIRQVRVPLGVAAVIYESRPNVTVDAFAPRV